jgi:hypothetical protein
MHSFAPDHALGAGTIWVRLLARTEIGTAISLLEEAGAALVALVDASDWQSEGFRALHELLARMRDDTGVEIGNLRVREWELNAGGAE